MEGDGEAQYLGVKRLFQRSEKSIGVLAEKIENKQVTQKKETLIIVRRGFLNTINGSDRLITP
jgi:hypothetical protein